MSVLSFKMMLVDRECGYVNWLWSSRCESGVDGGNRYAGRP